eukprot:COSAG06_NODE_203_length_20332_cov_14.679978_11_plen_1688_part_00
MAASSHVGEPLRRSCDLDAPEGPYEVSAEDWDGASVWIGNIPVSPTDGRCTKGGALDLVMTWGTSTKRYQLADELAAELNGFGDGLDADRCIVFGHQRTWALVSFRKRQDAEACLASDIRTKWTPTTTESPRVDEDADEWCKGLLLKRTISAEQARADREYIKSAARERREMVELCVTRIHSWLKRSGRQLSDLFTKIDQDGSGELDSREFRVGMLQIGLTFEDAEISALFAHMDSDGSGTISTIEFIDKMDQFTAELSESAGTILLHLCLHLDREKKMLADVFQGVDVDGSGDLTADEFHDALLSLDISHKKEAAAAVIEELDMDGDATITLAELSTQLAVYRRKRRAFVANVFNQCFEHINTSGQSATQIFSRVDVDGSGELDVLEFQESMRRMGQNLSPNQAFEVMAELDLDGSGTIGVSEFLDKLKYVRAESEGRVQKCKQLFAEADDDGSGFLDEKEITYVAGKMGLSDMVSDPTFVTNMIHEMESLSLSYHGHSGSGSGTVDVDEFTHWFMEIGVSYLDKPVFSRTIDLVTPSEDDVQHMFEHVDSDRSGSVDLIEVQEELKHLWPFIDSTGFQLGFHAADVDSSGTIDLKEFRHLIAFIVWLNKQRHTVQELEEAFREAGVGEEEFYCGCMRLNFHCNDSEARFLFEQHCKHLGLMDDDEDGDEDEERKRMPFDEYITWAVRYACVTLKGEVHVESPLEARARQITFLSNELESMAGEYGDVHMVDLVSVMATKKTDFAHAHTGAHTGPIWKQALTKAVGAANECSHLLASAFESSTARNEGFPNLTKRSIIAIVQMCTRCEYFTGQRVIMQGDTDGKYFVLRRGIVEVSVDGVGRVGQMEMGMGFGEIGLLLNTKRTATITCTSPCELYVLERADYQTVISMLPKSEQLGPLVMALDNFWQLMTGPDGSRRESVDYKSYLKAHIRTSKTLTANSDVEDFDEGEERAVAQSDWSEDCARYGLKAIGCLSKAQYYDAMYQLVELWSGEQQLSYATFLTWVFENICYADGDHGYRFRKLDKVEAVGDKFETMRNEARSLQEAQQKVEVEVLMAAEEARRLHVQQQVELKRQQQQEAVAKRARQLEAERLLRESDELGAERAELTRSLSELGDEEAELRRQLATLEGAAAVRARLDAIVTERLALRAQLVDTEFNLKLASLGKQLAALDDEEAELRRRLAVGELLPEEEKVAIRSRLAMIALQREQLLRQRAAMLAAQAQKAADFADAKLFMMVSAIDQKLSVLDEEKAELLLQLTTRGRLRDLTTEEDAAIRGRLAEIATERAALLVQQHEISLARAASAPDKVAAETLDAQDRNSCGTSEGEEKEQEKEKEKEKGGLLYQLYCPITTHATEDRAMNRVSQNEISILRQQEREEQRVRRRRFEQQQAAAISLATSELTQGGSTQALGRQQRLFEQTAAAAREQQWVEFDASRLAPRQLAEWNHLRSTLRVSATYGRGWLGKVMREMNLRDDGRQHATRPSTERDSDDAPGPSSPVLPFACRTAKKQTVSLHVDARAAPGCDGRGGSVEQHPHQQHQLPHEHQQHQQQQQQQQQQQRRSGAGAKKRQKGRHKKAKRKQTQRGTGAASAPLIIHERAPPISTRLAASHFGSSSSSTSSSTSVSLSLSNARREAAAATASLDAGDHIGKRRSHPLLLHKTVGGVFQMDATRQRRRRFNARRPNPK